MTGKRISFGDTVRVRDAPSTRAAGVAGLTGPVYGETTPSATGVEVIGELTGDYAVNVHFEGRAEALWLAPDLLELVDHGAGTEVTINGVDRKWTRTGSGQWEESPGASTHTSFWQRVTGRVFRKKE